MAYHQNSIKNQLSNYRNMASVYNHILEEEQLTETMK